MIRIRGYLALALVAVTLLTTGVFMYAGHRWVVRTIEAEAVLAVGNMAEERRGTVERMVQRIRGRSRSFLDHEVRGCLVRPSAPLCLTEELRALVEREGASGGSVVVGGFQIVAGSAPADERAAAVPFISVPSGKGAHPDVTVSSEGGGGRVSLRFDGELFDDLFAGVGQPGGAFTSLLSDAGGRVISASDELEGVLGTRAPAQSPVLQRCLAGQDGEALGPNFRGQEVVHGFRSLARIGGGCVLVEVAQAAAFAPAARLRAALWPFVPLLLMVSALISVVIARRMTRPIERLVASAREVRRGNLAGGSVDVRGPAELRELGAAFDAMRGGLRESLATKERFIGILGHDLRNPLSAVQLSAERLARRLGPEDRSVAVIARSARRMERMVAQLLDFARAREGGGLRLRRERIDLGAVCRGVIDELREAHPDQPVELRAPVAAIGQWDGDRLAQVVSNLVGNAVQHAPAGEAVTVAVEATGADVTLTVKNGGAPIPEELIPVLFEPFRTGRNAAGAEGGIGLGLYVVQQIVQAHGGALDVTSTAALGTTFRVRLPRRDPAEAAGGDPAASTAPSDAGARTYPACPPVGPSASPFRS